jgi:hypothetical protein
MFSSFLSLSLSLSLTIFLFVSSYSMTRFYLENAN